MRAEIIIGEVVDFLTNEGIGLIAKIITIAVNNILMINFFPKEWHFLVSFSCLEWDSRVSFAF